MVSREQYAAIFSKIIRNWSNKNFIGHQNAFHNATGKQKIAKLTIYHINSHCLCLPEITNFTLSTPPPSIFDIIHSHRQCYPVNKWSCIQQVLARIQPSNFQRQHTTSAQAHPRRADTRPKRGNCSREGRVHLAKCPSNCFLRLPLDNTWPFSSPLSVFHIHTPPRSEYQALIKIIRERAELSSVIIYAFSCWVGKMDFQKICGRVKRISYGFTQAFAIL